MSQFLMKNLCADPRLRSGNFAEDCTEGGRRARYVHIRGNGDHDRSIKQHAALRPWIGVHREAAVGHDQSGVSRVACNWTWRANWTCVGDMTLQKSSRAGKFERAEDARRAFSWRGAKAARTDESGLRACCTGH